VGQNFSEGGFFRPYGACGCFSRATHGLRRGLHSDAASRLGDGDGSHASADETSRVVVCERVASFAPMGLGDVFRESPTACAVGWILARLRGWRDGSRGLHSDAALRLGEWKWT